jgi:flagellin
MPVIGTNIAANTALQYLNKNSTAESSALAKISSGSRITSAADDAASLAISTNMKADIAVLQQVTTNVANGQAVLNTADGALSNISDVLTRMKALTTEAQSGSSDTTSLADIDAEYQKLLTEIGNISTQTTFNNVSLLDGTGTYNTGTGVSFQTGTSSTDTLSVLLGTITAASLAITSTNTLQATAAATALGLLTTAIATVSTERATVGADLSQLQYTGDTVATATTNLEAANSSLVDVDLSAEQTTFTNEQTLTSAAVTALTEANQMQQELLKVLQG